MATIKQKRAIKKVAENGGNVSRAMLDAGYSPATAKTPQKLTESKGWEGFMKQYLGDEQLASKHKQLLNSHRLDHMTFPLGPKEEGSELEDEDEEERKAGYWAENTSLTDDQIKQMLAEVNCTVRRIVHGQQARHVYFWSPDNRARKDALEMAYKLKAHFKDKESAGGDTFNTINIFSDERAARIARRVLNGDSPGEAVSS
jgi:hypothetical protein